MKTRIVIVGAGYAGILTAKKIAKKFKKLKKQDEVSVTIIDKNPFHTMLTELHEVAAGRVDEDSIKISLKKVFAGRKVELKLDTVNEIDFENRVVRGSNESYEYDYLVLAAGSQPTYFDITGAEEHVYKLWSYEDAVILKDRIHNVFRMAACEPDMEKKKELLTFFVVGAGFTGVEMVGELAEYVPFLCEKYEIDRKDVSLYNVDIFTRTVTVLPEKLSAKVERRLEKMGVKVMLGTEVVSIGEDFIEMKNGDKLEKYPAGTVVWAAGIESSDITGDAAKVLKSTGRGRINVDENLRSLTDERVYVVGDNMFYIAQGEEQPVPQMVENSEQSAGVAAKNIVSEITGTGVKTAYKPSFHGVMVSVGGRYGVAHVGLPNHMFSLPSFLAMFAKHFINIIYFIQVLGWNKVFSYMKHEFFTIRNCRSFVGGHFSNRTPSFFLVPLRIWLGAVWVFEGIMKIVEGWFKSPKLDAFFGGANSWYDSILQSASGVVDAASAATGVEVSDAVSNATGEGAADVAEKVGTVIFNFDFLGLFHAIFVSGKTLAESAIGDYAFKLDIPLMNWFVDKLILPNDGVQIFMQCFIVIAEILIGLALIGGLFTTPASAFSLVLQFMFVTTTGLYLGTVWMIFAGIAVLFGAGRTFGLDYYAMPALKKAWRRLPLIRKLYVYND